MEGALHLLEWHELKLFLTSKFPINSSLAYNLEVKLISLIFQNLVVYKALAYINIPMKMPLNYISCQSID